MNINISNGNYDGNKNNDNELATFKLSLLTVANTSKNAINNLAKIKKIAKRIRKKTKNNLQLQKLMLAYSVKDPQDIFKDVRNIEDWEKLEKNIDNTRNILTEAYIKALKIRKYCKIVSIFFNLFSSITLIVIFVKSLRKKK